jgi:hypothetical protein
MTRVTITHRKRESRTPFRDRPHLAAWRDWADHHGTGARGGHRAAAMVRDGIRRDAPLVAAVWSVARDPDGAEWIDASLRARLPSPSTAIGSRSFASAVAWRASLSNAPSPQPRPTIPVRPGTGRMFGFLGR